MQVVVHYSKMISILHAVSLFESDRNQEKGDLG